MYAVQTACQVPRNSSAVGRASFQLVRWTTSWEPCAGCLGRNCVAFVAFVTFVAGVNGVFGIIDARR